MNITVEVSEAIGCGTSITQIRRELECKGYTVLESCNIIEEAYGFLISINHALENKSYETQYEQLQLTIEAPYYYHDKN